MKRGKICSQNRAHDPALSDDTRLNLRDKTMDCTDITNTKIQNILERK